MPANDVAFFLVDRERSVPDELRLGQVTFVVIVIQVDLDESLLVDEDDLVTVTVSANYRQRREVKYVDVAHLPFAGHGAGPSRQTVAVEEPFPAGQVASIPVMLVAMHDRHRLLDSQ